MPSNPLERQFSLLGILTNIIIPKFHLFCTVYLNNLNRPRNAFKSFGEAVCFARDGFHSRVIGCSKGLQVGFFAIFRIVSNLSFFSSPLELISIVLVIMSVNFVQLMKIYETYSASFWMAFKNYGHAFWRAKFIYYIKFIYYFVNISTLLPPGLGNKFILGLVELST